jgi:hypothetical protein
VLNFTPLPLYPQVKNPWYPLDRRQGGPQSRFRHGGEEKNSQPLRGLETPIIQLVARSYTTELSQTNILYASVISSMRATYSTHHIMLQMLDRTIFYEE